MEGINFKMKKLKNNENGKFLSDIIVIIIIIAVAFFIYKNFFEQTKTDTHNVLAKFEALDSDLPDFKKYYYNQLDDNGKIIYHTILNNLDNLKEGTSTIKIDINEPNLSDSFQNAWDAICLDRPEIFYIDTNKLMLESQSVTSILGKTTYSYTLKPNSVDSNYLLSTWNSKSAVDSSISQLETVANKVVTLANGSRYNQVQYIHDYIVENTSYDNSSSNASNVYGTLVNGKALCEGYSESFKYLLDKLNIPNVIVYGKGIKEDSSTEEHSWNYVQMDDGNWYAVDCTWDDPIIVGSGILPLKYKYKYFLVGSKTFFVSHQEENYVSSNDSVKTSTYFTYPTLSESNYK